MQASQREKGRKDKQDMEEFSGIPKSGICGRLPPNSEHVSIAVLDIRTNAVLCMRKSLRRGMPEVEEQTMTHDKSGQKLRNKKAGRKGHTKGCSAFQGIRLKQGAGTGKRIVMT